jgi:hypothetical protein
MSNLTLSIGAHIVFEITPDIPPDIKSKNKFDLFSISIKSYNSIYLRLKQHHSFIKYDSVE